MANYNDFFYGYEDNKIVVKSLNKVIPKTLFRYLKLNENSLEGILNNQVYACQPDSFNDIFDCNKKIVDIKNVEWEQIKVFFKDDIYAKSMYDNRKSEFLDFFHNVFYNFFICKLGLYCTTGCYKNDLFWSYYNNHEGVCLEIDYSKFEKNFQGPFPINYVDDNKFERIDFSKYSGFEIIGILTNIKKSIWRHEDEYRFIVVPQKCGEFITTGRFNNEINPYPRESRIVDIKGNYITSIILGFRFFEIGEVVSEFNDEYIISIKNSVLKIKLLEYITINKIDTFGMIYDDETLKFDREKLKISKIDEGRFKIIRE